MSNENWLFIQVWFGIGLIVGIIGFILDKDSRTVGDLLFMVSVCMALGPVSLYFLFASFIKSILDIKIKK